MARSEWGTQLGATLGWGAAFTHAILVGIAQARFPWHSGPLSSGSVKGDADTGEEGLTWGLERGWGLRVEGHLFLCPPFPCLFLGPPLLCSPSLHHPKLMPSSEMEANVRQGWAGQPELYHWSPHPRIPKQEDKEEEEEGRL